LRIFFEICGLYKGKGLVVDTTLYAPMLTYIADQSEAATKQASGFLKLAFENGVGLPKDFPLHTIKKFDKEF
jgi:hypothetical protein